MLLAVVAGVVVAVFAAVVAARTARMEAMRAASAAIDIARGEVAAEIKAAELAAAARKISLETQARSEALEIRAQGDEAVAREEATVERRAEALARAESNLAARLDALDQRHDQVEADQKEVQARRDRASGIERDVQTKLQAGRGELETRAGVRGAELIARLGQAWIDDARARAAAELRSIDQTAADPAHDREARRVMEIAGARYHHHYLTERAMNNLRIGPELVAILLDGEAAMHKALERVSGLQLLVNDDKNAIRLDGLDGVGKEMVRRAIGRMIKKPETIDAARQDPDAWATKARDHLNQEIRSLGKRAFQILGIQKAHPEIVELVGALNYRTSYTQNQWWHAV
ncbi:MAG: hypothetical protein ABI867_41430, partial [Kofleriaceae bacterium]